MTAPNHRWRKFKNAVVQTVAFACAILVITPLVLVFYHLVTHGFTAINWAFFTRLPLAASFDADRARLLARICGESIYVVSTGRT